MLSRFYFIGFVKDTRQHVFAAASMCTIISSKWTLISEQIFALDGLPQLCAQ